MVELIDKEVYAKYDENPSVNGRVIGLWKLCLVALPTLLMNLSIFNDYKCGTDALKCYDTNHEYYDYDMKLIWIIFSEFTTARAFMKSLYIFRKVDYFPLKSALTGKNV